ncbi:MAG: hypothetical protein ACETWM_19905 [Candidatus Lokiarchaeia archaeon]
MKRLGWQFYLSVLLITISVFFYLLHYIFFSDEILIQSDILLQLAFIPISVLIVTIIIDELIERRVKMDRLKKLNILIGSFFSEFGIALLISCSNADPNVDRIRKILTVKDNWTDQEFNNAKKQLVNYSYEIDIHGIHLDKLRNFLSEKRIFLLRVMENPTLLEHESFTNVLLSIFHVLDELVQRKEMKKLPDRDLEHLEGDINRAYTLLVNQWLDYMKYMKDNYPYLFSLAMRTNPFDKDASPIIK